MFKYSHVCTQPEKQPRKKTKQNKNPKNNDKQIADLILPKMKFDQTYVKLVDTHCFIDQYD